MRVSQLCTFVLNGDAALLQPGASSGEAVVFGIKTGENHALYPPPDVCLIIVT